MYTLQRFKALFPEKQLQQLTSHGISLDLAFCIDSTEAIVFAYNDFYVELVVEKVSDDIIAINCFRSVKKLTPYLHQVDISEITSLLACSK